MKKTIYQVRVNVKNGSFYYLAAYEDQREARQHAAEVQAAASYEQFQKLGLVGVTVESTEVMGSTSETMDTVKIATRKGN